MSDAIEVVTLGECMAVLYPGEPEPLESAHGLLLDVAGSEANTAIGLARLGHRARFVSRVGDDPLGRRIRATLSDEGVDVADLVTDPVAPTGVFFREWLADGTRRVYYYRAGSAASRMTPAALKPESFAGARIVHLSGITPALSPGCADTVSRAMALAHQQGALVSFDPNYRAPLWPPATAREALIPLIEQADILLIGHEDAKAVLDTVEDQAVLERAAKLGPKTVVLKRAEQGASAMTDGKRIDVPAHAVSRAVDPVGAGDGFNAGFLAGWLRGYDIEAALKLGNKIGAKAVEVLGDYAGYPKELKLT